MKKIFQSGQLLIELVVAVGIAAIFFPALAVGILSMRDGRAQAEQRFTALGMIKESMEAVRVVRGQGWEAFAVNGMYYTQRAGNGWELVSGASSSAGFTKSLTIEDVSRNASGAIVTSGGDLDPSTKKVTHTVSWSTPRSGSISMVTYLTRYMDNLTYLDTTQADFQSGTLGSTVITNVSGGEVILAAGGGGGDWCDPSKSITQVDLPKSGVANAITAIEGRLFIGTGANASGESFVDVKLSTTQDPPQVTLPLKSYSSSNKTNGVFGEANYGYITTDTNDKEVIILNLNQFTDPPTNTQYAIVGTIDVPGNTDGESVYVLNNKAYIITASGKLFIYDITNRSKNYTTTEALNGSSGYSLSGAGKRILLGASGMYAYVITDSTTNNFEIINVTNPASPVRSSIRTIGSAQTGADVFVDSTESLAYVAVAYSSGKNNVYKVTISDKGSPTVGASYSTNGMNPTGVTAVTGNRAIIVGKGGAYQYQVINTSTMALCSATSQLTYGTGINAVAAVLQANGYAYSYILTGDASNELQIILGGAGGQYTASGTFTSRPFDVATVGLTQTAFNRFTTTFVQPPQTSIGYQVAVADAVSNSCTNANYTFIGPGRTSLQSDVFTTGGPIPLMTSGNYHNPGRCFKYKVYFSSNDPTQTPELDDVTVNFSP